MPDRFYHRVARILREIELDSDKRLVNELFEQVEHLELFDAVPGTHLLEGLKRAPASEDPHPPKGNAFLFRKKIVTPVDEGLECLLMRQPVSTPATQETETVVKA